MWRVLTSTCIALTFFASSAAAQQPCTTDANRVVSEIYRHVMERQPDPGAQTWVNQLANGQTTVRELVRTIAKSEEHMRNFGQREAGEGQPYERAVARMYRHILGRQADPDGQRVHAQSAQQNGNLNAVVDSLINSPEYTNSFGDWGVPGSGGVNFCANNRSTSTAAPAPQQVRSQITDRRFRGMDRNRDGEITRAEWNGSDQSFRIHDWDGNGILEDDEVRQGAARPGRAAQEEEHFESLEDLDTNRNNRVEPREWHASLDSFVQADRNDDGVLSRAEMEAHSSANPRRTGRRANDYDFAALDANRNNRIERREWQARGDVFNQLDVDRNNVLSRAELEVVVDDGGNFNRRGIGTTGDFIIVDSSVRWTDTGLDVRAGQILTFDADGEIRLSNNPGDFAAPGGSSSGRRAADSPVRTAPAGGLIARIGNGRPVYVGGRTAVRVPSSGRLYLSVNDDHLADNQGEYRVTVNVR